MYNPHHDDEKPPSVSEFQEPRSAPCACWNKHGARHLEGLPTRRRMKTSRLWASPSPSGDTAYLSPWRGSCVRRAVHHCEACVARGRSPPAAPGVGRGRACLDWAVTRPSPDSLEALFTNMSVDWAQETVFTVLEESGSLPFSLFCLFSVKTVQNSENSELPDASR